VITVSYDVIAIGGGFAGLVTACRAAELGLRAAVLEKKTDERYVCNSRYTSGVFVVMGLNALSPAEKIEAAIIAATDGAADPALARAVAANASRTIDWIRAQGGRMLQVEASDMKQLVMAPPRRMREGLDWEGRGGDVLMRTLEENLRKKGGEVLRGVKAESLIMQEGRCVGVNATREGREVSYAANAVVIADGGFQGNADRVRRHLSKHPDRVLVRAAPGGDGDGIAMAEAVGAATGGYGAFYGHLHHREAMSNPNLWPYPHFDSVAMASLLVGADGRRFTDEGLGGVCMSNAIARLDDPLSAFVIFDDAIWNGAPAKARPVGPNPYLMSGGASLISAPDIATLAGTINLPVDALQETVRQHNDAVSGGRFDALLPPRSAKKSIPMPIIKAPFHAAPLCTGITGTMGGMVISTNAQVRRDDGVEIGGLYAVGTPIAGLEGGPRAGYVGGLSKAFILGLLAAEHMAAQAR